MEKKTNNSNKDKTRLENNLKQSKEEAKQNKNLHVDANSKLS